MPQRACMHVKAQKVNDTCALNFFFLFGCIHTHRQSYIKELEGNKNQNEKAMEQKPNKRGSASYTKGGKQKGISLLAHTQ